MIHYATLTKINQIFDKTEQCLRQGKSSSKPLFMANILKFSQHSLNASYFYTSGFPNSVHFLCAKIGKNKKVNNVE